MSSNPLEGLVDLFNGAASVAKEVGKPLDEVYHGLSTAENDIDSVENFIGDLNEVVTLSETVSGLCYGLSEIPVVGDILGVLGKTLDDFGKTVAEILEPINTFKKEILDDVKKVIHKINGFLAKITKFLNFFINNLPRWVNTLQVLYFGWQIVSVLVRLLDGTEPAKRLEKLMNTIDDIAKQVKSVYDDVVGGLKPIISVIKEVLEPVWDGMKIFFGWFESIMHEAQNVLGIFHKANNTVKKIEHAIKPIKWALDAVKCIFEKIFKPVLDWIEHELGINKIANEIKEKLENALHIHDFLEQLDSAFKTNKLGGATDKLSSSQDKVSKVHQLNEILKQFIADPQQAMIDALLSAISGTPVKDDAFPPRPPPAPPLDFGGNKLMVMSKPTPTKMMFAVRPRLTAPQRRLMKLVQSMAAADDPVVTLSAFPVVAAPTLQSSLLDWSDVDQFVKDVDSINASLKSSLTLGAQLQQYISKAQAQVDLPQQLHGKLDDLQTETQFLYDFVDLLKLFPVFKVFLPPVATGLEGELQSIKGLDGDMGQFVNAASSLSTSLQPIVKAENPTLIATFNQLTSSLNNWKSQAQKYQGQIKQAYTMDEKAKKKFTPKVDALAKTYHQRLGELQSLLSQIKDQATAACSTSHTIVQALSTVSGDFDKIDPYVKRLEDDISSVSQLANWAGRLDGIFSPLKGLLTTYKCVGDDNDIKSTQLKPIKIIMEISAYPSIQQDFKLVVEKLLNEFFPVQSVDSLIKMGLSDVQNASAAIAGASGSYLSALTSLENLQVGKYQFQYKNKKTKKIETIDSHFFSAEQVQQALDLGKALSKATGTPQ